MRRRVADVRQRVLQARDRAGDASHVLRRPELLRSKVRRRPDGAQHEGGGRFRWTIRVLVTG